MNDYFAMSMSVYVKKYTYLMKFFSISSYFDRSLYPHLGELEWPPGSTFEEDTREQRDITKPISLYLITEEPHAYSPQEISKVARISAATYSIIAWNTENKKWRYISVQDY